jgi:hypothetical protein
MQLWPGRHAAMQAPQLFGSPSSEVHRPVQQLSPFVQSLFVTQEAGAPHLLGVPLPPHVSGAVHPPQSSLAPQPSGTIPQAAPTPLHVTLMQVEPLLELAPALLLPPEPAGKFVQTPAVHSCSELQSPSALHWVPQTPVVPHP